MPAYFELKQLASNYPQEAELVLGVLANTVRVLAMKPKLSTQNKTAVECNGFGAEIRDREAADPEIQLSIKILGDKDMSRVRNSALPALPARPKEQRRRSPK